MGLLFNGRIGDARKEISQALRLYPGDAESYLVKSMMAANGKERQRLYGRAVALNKELGALRPEFLQVPVHATM